MNIKKTNIEGTELKILVLEDSTRDLELMRELLSNAGYRLDLTHVENEAGFTASLHENSFDLILADFKLPDFDGFGALQISRELCPETPFICVSGVIGEETAAELLKLGAMDYVLKDRLERLPYAVKRALEEAKAKADYQKAEKALRESEEKLRSIYRVAPAGIGVVSNRLLKEVNPRVCEMTGYTREELIDKNARILYPTQEEYEFVGKKKYDEIKEKGIGEVETRWQKKDGSIINVLLASTFIEKNDHSKEVIFTALDITERKHVENELKEKTSFLSTIMETSPVGIVTIDKTGNITYANNRAEQILGLEKEKITSTTYDAPLWKHTDLDGSPFPEENLPFNIVRKTLNTVFDVQHGITWPDGTVVILSVNAAPIKDHNGEFNGMIASIEDISERKQAEEEKATLLNNISERNKELNFLFQVSRFIENPEASLESILQDTTLMISQAWQYPEMTCARIVLEGKEYKTDNFQRTKWKQSTAVIINGKDAGKIEVCYLGKKPEHYKEIFLKEEQELLDTLGRLLGDITERKKAEEALRLSEKHNAFLAQTAFELVELSSIQEIYKYTVRKLYELFEGNSIVSLVEYNYNENRWKMQQIKGVGKKTADLSKLLGFDIKNLEGDISTKYYEQITSGKVEELEFDLPSFFNNKLSAAIGSTVKKMFAVEKLYSITFQKDEHIMGNISFTTNKKSEPVNTKLIESFVQQVSTFVKKQKAEKHLKESEERFKALHNASFGGIAIHDKGVILECNQGLSDITGYSLEELIGMDGLLLIAPESRDMVMDNILAGYEKPYEAIGLRKNGELYPLRLEARNIPYKGKQVRTVEFRDITEIKKAEEVLHQSEEKYRTLVNSTLQGVIIAKSDPVRLVFANPAMVQISGYSSERLLKMDTDELATLIYKEDQQRFFGNFQKRIEGENIPQTNEYRMVTKDGTIKWVALYSSRIEYQNEPASLTTFMDITERKKAENALIESEDRFKKLSSFTFEGIVIHNNAIVIDVNQSTLNLFGYDKDEITGMNLFSVIHPDSHALVKENILKQVVTPYQIVVMRKDGSIFDAEIEARETSYNDESFRVACVRDITKRKQAEKIKQVEYNIAQATITTRNLNELFDSIKIELNSIIDVKNFVIALYNEETGMLNATVDRDEKGEIPEWSAEKSLTGYAIKQNRPVLLQKNEILRLHKEGIIELIGTTAEAWLGVPLKVEGEILGAVIIQDYDNPDVYNQTSIEIMELVAHELSMFIDRQRSEEKAIKLSRAVEQSSVSIMITNREGTIEYVNPFFEELTGYSFEEVKGKNSNILNSGRQSQAFYKELWDTILSGNDWEGEMLNKKKNEDLYWEKAVISPIVNSEGVITNFVAIKEDITERKKMLEELVIAKEKAEESDKLKTAFINNISHEIRTPLNGILGFGTILSETDPSPEDKKEMLAYLQQSGNRLMNTMTDYMDIAHIVSGTMEVHKKEFLLQPVFVEVIEENMQLFTDKKIDFEADYQNNFELTLDSDPALIKRVLNILLDNALKFTTEGSIRCGYKVKEKFVEFFVQDTGKGIAPEKLDAIFNNFIQEDTLATRAYEGSGLGLSITSGLVKLLGGTISVTSEPEVGSTFTFTVPIKIARR